MYCITKLNVRSTITNRDDVSSTRDESFTQRNKSPNGREEYNFKPHDISIIVKDEWAF